MRFLDALNGVNSGRPPVWLMRQAGRYLPEYRDIRSRHTFLEMIHSPELITEITLMPINRFGFDAAILFSDILVIAEACGFPLTFEEKGGPRFQRAIEEKDIDSFSLKNDPTFVYDGIRRLKKELKVPLIGFAGAPFTVASYLIEGKSNPEFSRTKEWIHKQSLPKLLDKVADATIHYLKEQEKAGVDAIQLFDTWANLLPPEQALPLSIDICRKIAAELTVPVIYFSKSSHHYLTHLSDFTAISLSETADIKEARRKTPQTLQGNFDSKWLLQDKAAVIRETRKLLDQVGKDPAYIFNLGHGILPETPLENVYAMTEEIFR